MPSEAPDQDGLNTFVPWDRPSPVLDRMGDFRRHADLIGRFGFVVDEPKLNARGFLHAGAISTLADVCIGHTLALTTEPPTALVTVSLNVDFTGTAVEGDWVDITVDVHRVGRRLAAGAAAFRNGEQLIAHASAIFVPASAERGPSNETRIH